MDTVILDVREPDEFRESHVEGAINIPLSALINSTNDNLNDLPKDSKIIVYCRTGSRSNTARDIIKRLGYKNVINGINKEQIESQQL